MKRSRIPANIYVLDTESPAVKALPVVTTLDIFDGATQEFHPDGLFSTRIFGRVGDPMRDKQFARITFKVPIFDPSIYDILISLKGLYKDIMAGTKFAVFDEDERDFIPSDPTKGDTGFDFFFQHWKKIEFKRTASDRRDVKIRDLMKYKDRAEIKSFLVMPAGLRDIETKDDGRPDEHEINDMYRKVLSAARVIEVGSSSDLRPVNGSRYLLQRAVHEIWQYIIEFCSGKTGFFVRKFASRNIVNGTRNVISAMNTVPKELGHPSNFTINDTEVGILQTAKGLLPVTIGNIRRHLARYVFSDTPEDNTARVIDPKTMKSIQIAVPFRVRDSWMTKDGLAKIIDGYIDVTLRDKPIMVGDCFMGLIYEGADMTFKIFHDMQELPEGFDKARVRPLTLTDLIYLLNVKDWEERHVLPTRYPITGLGSIYPSRVRVTSTVPAEVRKELNDDWMIDEDSMVVASYPIRGKGSYFDTMSVHPGHLGALGADHDGDMTSGNYIYSEEGVAELNRLMSAPNIYLSPEGGLRYSVDFYTTSLVAHNLTKEV